MTAKLCGVYLIRNTVNGKGYVGLSNDIHRRWRAHRKPKLSRPGPIGKEIMKHGLLGFEFSILELCQVDLLADRERHWIAALGTFENGYNLTSGGEQLKHFAASTREKMSAKRKGRAPWNKGKKTAPEVIAKTRAARLGSKWSSSMREKMEQHYASADYIAKVSAARSGLPLSDAQRARYEKMRGRKLSEEHKARISAGCKGKIFSKERCANISASLLGKTKSEEVKAKISATLTGRKQSRDLVAKRLATYRKTIAAREQRAAE